MKKAIYFLCMCLSISSYAQENYRLIVNLKEKNDEIRLKNLGFTKCKPLGQNTLLCLESKDINQLLRLRDFLLSQNIDAKVTEGKAAGRQTATSRLPSEDDTVKKETPAISPEKPKELDKKQDTANRGVYLITRSIQKQEKTYRPSAETARPNEDELAKSLRNMYAYLNSGDLSSAESIAKTILNTRYSPDAKFVIGLVNLKRENFKEACEIFSSLRNIKREARDLETESCWVFYMKKGYEDLENGRLVDAARNFQKSLSYRDNLESNIGMFYVHLKQGNLNLAEKSIKQLYDRYGENEKVKRAYVDFLIETKNFDELKKFEGYLTDSERQLLESQMMYTELEKASKLIKNREFETAENILKNLFVKHPSNIYVLLNLGYLYLEKGELYTAENYYKNVLVYDRSSREALKGLKAVYVKLGRYQDALEVIEKLKSLGVKDQDENKIRELHYVQKARDSLDNRDFLQAEMYAREALRINPGNPSAYLILANIYKEKGEQEEYFRYLSKAFELQPDNFGVKLAYMYGLVNLEMFDQVKTLLGTIDTKTLTDEEKEELRQFYRLLYNRLASYYLNNKDFKRAKKVATEGLEIFRTDGGLLEVLGWSCYNLKDYTCSRNAFEQAVALNPSNEMARLGLAYVYLNSGERDKVLKLTKLLEKSKDAKVLEGVTTIYISLGKYSDAENILNRIETLKQKEVSVPPVEGTKTLPEKKLPAGNIEREVPFILEENFQQGSKLPYNRESRRDSTGKGAPDTENNKLSGTEETPSSLKDKIKHLKQDYTSSIETGVKYRERSGEKGKSRLTDTSPYIIVSYFLNEKVNIYAGSFITSLDSGNLSDYQNFGSPQNGEILRQVPSGYTGAEPFAGLSIDGERFSVISRLSSTPLVDNRVSEKVTYMIEGKIKTEETKTGAGIYRRPVRDTVLSYTGTIDPYTQATSWGRATEEGVRVSFEKFQGDTYLIYSELSAGNIRGKDIQENRRINFILMPKVNIGSVISDKDFAGLFIMYDRFSKDQDCYYYGCGGYFSPKNLLIFAPMLEGYRYAGENFGLHYKVFLGFLNMNYKGNTSSDISFDGYIGGIYRLHSNMFLKLAGEYRRTSRYNELFSSLSFQYFFGHRYGVTEKDLLKQEKEIYKLW